MWLMLVYSAWISWLMLPRSVSDSVAFEAWTARSRIRCKLEVTSSRAPSAVWIIEIPSWAFIAAWFSPPIWDCIFVEMARPAASSAELVIRKPDDNRCIEVCRALLALKRACWAFREATLVRIDIDMTRTPFFFRFFRELFGSWPSHEVSSRASRTIRGNFAYGLKPMVIRGRTHDARTARGPVSAATGRLVLHRVPQARLWPAGDRSVFSSSSM